MAKFTFTPSSLPRLSRKAVLGIAAALAVTGATGAAALLAPSNFTDPLPAVSAQTVSPAATPDIMSQEPFDHLVQTATAPTTDAARAPAAPPETTQQPRPTATATPTPRSTTAPPTDTTSRRIDRQSQRAPLQRAAAPNAPLAEAPAADTTAAQPQGEMIPTAAPGVIETKKRIGQTKFVAEKQIIRPRAVYIPVEICND